MNIKNIFVAFIFSLVLLFTFSKTPVSATAGGTIFGSAWSSNIGWISFNNCTDATTCTGVNYGVTMDIATGDLSGYAWSSNIGWISFNNVGSPSGSASTAKVDLVTGKMTGWARACSVFASGCSGALENDSYRGGWDGYIALSGSTSGTAWGFTLNTNKTITGYIWGSDVIGWISGVDLTVALPTVTATLTANPTSVFSGNPSILTWGSSSNATACTGTGFSTGNATSGTATVNPTSNTNYSVKCVAPGSSATANALVSVSSCPAHSTLNGSSCTCDTGYHDDGTGTCVINVTSCPPGQVVSNGVCITPIPAVCVPPLVNDPLDASKCIKKTIKPIYNEN